MSKHTKGMSGHQSSRMGKDEWLTPRLLIQSLGAFDLDPYSPCEDVRPWPTAKKHYCKCDLALMQPWEGRVWLNPPYGTEAPKAIARLAQHGNGIALLFARTETEMFHDSVWPYADAILFLKGRLHFHHIDGVRAKANAGAPSCLIAYGWNNVLALAKCGWEGKLIILKTP